MSHEQVFRLMSLKAAGMSTPMGKETSAIIRTLGGMTIFLCFIIPSLLSARSDRMLVLPFRITGKAPPAHFHESELPEQSMQAALFLARLVRDYRAVAYSDDGDRIQGMDEQTAENRIESLCSDPQISHLLGGQLFFTGANELTVEIFTASCIRKSILYRDSNSGSINELQSLMRAGIFRATPFLPENTSYARLQNFEEMSDRHTHVVVDLSGSMELSLPFIRRALEQIEPSRERTVAFTVVGSSARIEHSEAFYEAGAYLKTVRALHGSGVTTETSLIDGLRRARTHIKPGTNRMLFFSDAVFSEKGMLQLQEIFSDFKRAGVELAFFPGYGTDPSFLDRTGRFERIARVYQPVFARRAGFLTGEATFFVRRGASYFLCPGNSGDEIASGRLDIRRCQAFPAHRYSREELDLDRIAQAYADRNGLKINGISPVYSDMEYRIADFVTDRSGSRAPYRVLVQNGNRAFWVGLNRKEDYTALSNRKGKKLYIGLHLKKTGSGIENIPARIYILPDAEIPRLFLLEYERLLTLNRAQWNVRDAWFFLVEVRDYRHE